MRVGERGFCRERKRQRKRKRKRKIGREGGEERERERGGERDRDRDRDFRLMSGSAHRAQGHKEEEIHYYLLVTSEPQI